jgi:hypothetical protein
MESMRSDTTATEFSERCKEYGQTLSLNKKEYNEFIEKKL